MKIHPINIVKRSLLLKTAAIGLLALSVSACAGGGVPLSSTLGVGAALPAPVGYLDFCRRRPDQCDLAPMTPDHRLALTFAMAAALRGGASLRPASIGQPLDQGAAPVPSPGASIQDAPAAVDDRFDGGTMVERVVDPIAPGELFFDQPDLSMIQPLSEGSQIEFPAVRPAQQAQDQTLVAERRPLAMSPALWATLTEVDRDINQRIRPASDLQAFGVDNFWDLPLGPNGRGMGNCKHYALEKRRELVEAGVPSSALYLAIVRTRWGEIHSILVVATDQGDYVLDNLSPWVTPWREAGYVWLARQIPGAPLEWAAPATEAPARTSHTFALAANPSRGVPGGD
jgi:predicted transglutaminase-like cysteine proteinase